MSAIALDNLNEFQSTHSLRSATRAYINQHLTSDVSIHALLAECDLMTKVMQQFELVSIHALLAECDIS